MLKARRRGGLGQLRSRRTGPNARNEILAIRGELEGFTHDN